MFRRGPEFPIPLLNREEILGAIDELVSDKSGATVKERLTSLQTLSAELELRIIALREFA